MIILSGEGVSALLKTAVHSRKRAPIERAILMAFIAALLIKIFFLDLMVAEGHSMTPAIKPGTILLVCKVFYGIRMPISGSYLLRWRGPHEGDVVVFFTPLGEIAVKRCAEITGEINGGQFYALGDNASQSYDSRYYGPVPKDNIIGRVLGIRR